jgi:GT2 family glycosyltransferase
MTMAAVQQRSNGLRELAPLRIGIAIATADRPEIVAETVRLLARQGRRADRILVCSPRREDGAGTAAPDLKVVHLLARRGLPHQRNRLLDAATDLDILLFLDDDFVMAEDYLAEVEAAFAAHPDVAMVTGKVVSDGIISPGLSFFEALEELSRLRPVPSDRLAEVYNGYGCNMAVRLDVVRTNRVRFDEELPLYAWLEDVDFSRSLARFGRIVRAERALGVHLGVKAGRQRGVRLGYSQIANPCYLIAKGTCSWKKGLYHMVRNIAANVWGTLRGDASLDRRGRLLGNAKGLLDLIKQRLAPSRALRL